MKFFLEYLGIFIGIPLVILVIGTGVLLLFRHQKIIKSREAPHNGAENNGQLELVAVSGSQQSRVTSQGGLNNLKSSLIFYFPEISS